MKFTVDKFTMDYLNSLIVDEKFQRALNQAITAFHIDCAIFRLTGEWPEQLSKPMKFPRTYKRKDSE